MPATLNGVGTMYGSTTNVQTRTGVCSRCQRHVLFESYDTRLWFVVLFIPLIPLGRKRIIDSCTSCSYHYVMSADEYATAGQKVVIESASIFEQEPTTAAALATHANLLAFHKYPEAAALRTQVIAQFLGDAELLVGFARQLDNYSREDAIPLYRQAYELDPQLPGARLGVAAMLMNAGKLDEARHILDFLEQSGAGKTYSLGELETLAMLYQSKDRHAEALQLFRHLIAELPDLIKVVEFRRKVGISERKLGTAESLLPKPLGGRFAMLNPLDDRYTTSHRGIALAVLVVMGFLAFAAVANEAIRRTRSLYIVHGLNVPVTVQVDDLPPIEVKSREKVTLKEGHHRVVVTSPFHSEYPVTIRTGYLERLYRKPLWAVNVAGTAAAVKTDAVYSDSNPQPAKSNLLAGQTWIEFPHVDYVFEELPETIKLDRHSSNVRKSGINIQPIDREILQAIITDPGAALTFLEAHLYSEPDDTDLLEKYSERARAAHAETRAEPFLKAGLARRPVEVHRHRAYQDFLILSGKLSELIATYDSLLKAEPKDGRLLFLRSRIEVDQVTQIKLLEQAIEADPNLAWPWHSLLKWQMSRGDWDKSAQAQFEAEQRHLDPVFAYESRHLVRLATGDSDGTIAESRAILAEHPQQLAALLQLLDAHVVRGQPQDAQRELAEWKARNPLVLKDPQLRELLDNSLHYMTGDLDKIEKSISDSSSPIATHHKINLWLATGHPEKIIANPAMMNELKDSWTQVGLSVAYHAKGAQADAIAWRDRAVESLKSRSLPEQFAGKMLGLATGPSAEDLTNLTLDVDQKLVLLCALAQKFPTLAKPCGDLAHKLNVSRVPPYQLVNRIFASSPVNATPEVKK